jgi:hypothetical protein
VVCNTHCYWAVGPCPSYGIKKKKTLEAESVSVKVVDTEGSVRKSYS